MRTTFDAEADAAYVSLIPETEPGWSVRNEVVETLDGTVVLDFDRSGVLLGVEVLGATKMFDQSTLAGAVRLDQ
ncbi:DUF2283 domain-containing protein [Xanthomonas oryzae]|uniref:DUF2283 domain-containing protein n=1 Tax=Xanthomonas oryzae TaxID=347 RepID=UPI00094A00A9|nr:DUF2283 domain-containing protein [Xanthomonas oryzae]OLI09410.1 hypothetical protein DXO242_20605 [Xanthomonas oryzae pv. oryzae]